MDVVQIFALVAEVRFSIGGMATARVRYTCPPDRIYYTRNPGTKIVQQA